MSERRTFLKNLGLAGLGMAMPGQILSTPAGANDAEGKTNDPVVIKGMVRAAGGKGLADVSVSDGFQVVRTSRTGSFEFVAHSDAVFAHVILPAGYKMPHIGGLAGFYTPILRDKRINTMEFTLAVENDIKHMFILWADPQIQTDAHAEELLTVSIPDLKQTLASYPADLPRFGIACGDLVWDNLNMFAQYKKSVAMSEITFHQVIGNHDLDMATRSDEQSSVPFQHEFGPAYYAFNKGKVHYVVMDNVFFLGMAKKYIGYIPETQLQWLEQDLAHVSAGTTVILSLHIPTLNGVSRRSNHPEDFTHTVANRDKLYSILKPYRVHILSGHTHFSEHVACADNITEHIHGAVCGAWWSGSICWDGTPKGYSVYEIDGDEVKWHYKSVGEPRERQMRIYPRATMADKPNRIVVNVWNWDPQWKIEWLEDGVLKGMMTQFTGLDPLSVELYAGKEKPAGKLWIDPVETDHLFFAEVSTTAKKIEVKATDCFGQVFKEEMTL